MPTVSTSDLNTLRTSPQRSRLGLLVFRPTSIASGQVSGSSSQGATTITLSSFSQTEAPDTHFSVIAGSSAGEDDGGKTRLLSISSNTLTLADNNIEWATYPFVSVLKVIEPFSILPDVLNDTVDGNPYVDENTQYHPLGRIGPPVLGFTNEVVKFHSDSTVVAGGGCAVSSHSWTFPSGSPSSSSSAGSVGSPIDVTWSAATGHTPHYLKYVVTDTNGKTHPRYNPVWILDSFDDTYCDFELEGLSGDYSSGTWTAQVTVYGGATADEFPEDAMVVIASEDFYAGLKASIGGNWAYRENILFMGWIVQDTVFQDDDDGTVSFEIVGPVGKLDQLLSWPANFEFVDDFTGTWGCSTSTWQEFSGMTCDRIGFHLITVRTTMDHICDLYLTGNTKFLRYADIPETNVRDQLDNYALSPIGARVLSNRQGQIYFSRNPNLRPEGERTGIADVLTLTFDDIRADPGFELGEEVHEPQVAQVDFIGFNYDGAEVTPLYSLAPETQYHAGVIEKVDGIRADSQSEANTLAGLYLANFNNIWREVQVPSYNYRVWDIVPEEYTRLTLAADDTERGIVWSNQKLICRSVSIEYDNDALLVSPVFEKDSLGPTGITGFYPTSIPEADPTLPDAPGEALVAFGSFYFRRSGSSSWELRDCVPTLNHGTTDPWWFHPTNANSLDPNKARFLGCGDSGLITVSDLDGGYNWVSKTVSDPPNTWGDSPAPTADDVDFVFVGGDLWRKNRFYALGQWQNGSSEWRGWLYYTDERFERGTWVELYDGISLPTGIKPKWAAVNGSFLLVTIWENDSSTYTQRLLEFSPLTLLYGQEFSLGTATSDPDNITTFPVTVVDNDNVWYVAGHMDQPVGLATNDIQIIRTLNAGSVWATVESGWGSDSCSALKVGKLQSDGLRHHWAVRGN